MIRLVHSNEISKVNSMPKEVVEVTSNILKVLDEAYSDSRSIEDMGGYVVVIESIEDIDKFNESSINFKEDIVYEYIDIIATSNEEKYINAMTLVSDDYSVSFIMKLEYAPNSIKEQL